MEYLYVTVSCYMQLMAHLENTFTSDFVKLNIGFGALQIL